MPLEKGPRPRFASMVALSMIAAVACARPPEPEVPSRGDDPSDPERPFLFNVDAPLRSAPGGPVLHDLGCGLPLRILERTNTATHVSGGSDENWLDGWVDDADLASAASRRRCDGPLYVYNAFQRDGLSKAERLMPPGLVLAERDHRALVLPRSFWRIRDDAKGIRGCIEARVEGESLIEEGTTSGILGPIQRSWVESLIGTGRTLKTTWGFTVEPHRMLRMTGPSVDQVDRSGQIDASKNLHWLCLHEELVVARSKDAWTLVNAWGFKGAPFAYAPESAEPWYLSREACEKTLGPTREARTSTHRGCG